ncbi:MAG: pseudouridine synthase [Verrucomicrobiota bacterium]
MGQKSELEFVGFPPPLLGDAPFRLAVLANSRDLLALAKPKGVAVREHPWNRETPDMDAALNLQLKNGKPELSRLGAELFGSVYYFEPEVTGVAIFAKNHSSLELLRNSFGSQEMTFRYLLVARFDEANAVDCQTVDTPLLKHRTKHKMIPSTAKGKRARTEFKLLKKSKLGWSLWEATTNYPRLHQIRAHSALISQPILGDTLYGDAQAPSLQQVLPKKLGRRGMFPLFQGIALHLASVQSKRLNHSISDGLISAPLDQSFKVLLGRLEIDFGG